MGVLNGPNELLDRVVEVEGHLVPVACAEVGDGWALVLLKLFDEIVVLVLGESASLLLVEVDEVDVERHAS